MIYVEILLRTTYNKEKFLGRGLNPNWLLGMELLHLYLGGNNETSI